MPPQTLEQRVDRLEQRVTILEQLPARVDGLAVQISELRADMREEFSATRTELRAEIRAGDDNVLAILRREIRELAETVKTGNQEVMAQARMLYEEMQAKLKIIGEGRRKK